MISLRSKVTQKLLGYFFLNPKAEHYGHELARMLSLDPKNTHSKLLELEKTGLLESRCRGRERYFRIAPDFPLYSEYRRIALAAFGLEAQIARALGALEGVERALLFGSYASGMMDERSDVDLLVVGSVSPGAVRRVMLQVKRDNGREINAVTITPAELEKRRNEPFYAGILSGKFIELDLSGV